MNTASLFFQSLFCLYPQEDSDYRLEIRCLPPQWDADRPGPWPRRWVALQPQYLERAGVYCSDMAPDWDVYFGVLPRMGSTGRQENVSLAACLFVDVDGGDEGPAGAVVQIKAASVPTPHIAVRSGGGIHAYWFLSELVALPEHSDREGYKRTLRRLCQAIGGKSPAAHGDKSACEVARVLRVPGTFNLKIPTEPRPVRMIHYSQPGAFASARSYDWWKANLPQEPVEYTQKPRTERNYDSAGFVGDGLLRWADRGYPEGQRHHDLTGAAAWLVRDCGLSKGDALALLLRKANASPGRRQLTEREVEDMIRWA